MNFYFSGIEPETYEWALEANLQRLMVDPSSYAVLDGRFRGEVALDSGAYRAWKSGSTYAVETYEHFLAGLERLPALTMSLDVIGDPRATKTNYDYLRHTWPVTPVWRWGE